MDRRVDTESAHAVGAELKGATIWLTGLPGSGKSTTANGLHEHLALLGVISLVLDGDALRRGINADLGFTKDDRCESVRRAGEIALVAASQGIVAIASLVSPYASARDGVRRRHEEQGITFLETWLSAPLEVCEARGPRQLYSRARRGELQTMTGVNDPYEPATTAEIVLPTHEIDADEAVRRLVDALGDALAGGDPPGRRVTAP
jgi:adenylyl-sulfate kinase